MIRLKAILRRILREFYILLPLPISKDFESRVYDFFRAYPEYRSLRKCSEITGVSSCECARIRRRLYSQRKLGLYYFQAHTPPQQFMKERILKEIPTIHRNSYILEVGPGDAPLFSSTEYLNWYGVDKNFSKGTITFKDNIWGKEKYLADRIFSGGFETLSDVPELQRYVGKFDVVVASHVYEHTTLPLKSLVEIARMLKTGGHMVLFVPNGYSDDPNSKDPTHTLYINPGMMREFFDATGEFKDIVIEDFRPNADFIINAIKV